MTRAAGAIGLALVLATGCASAAGASQSDPAFLAVLDAVAACRASQGASCHAMDRIFDLKRNSKRPVPTLVNLLDYNLGAASSVTLGEFLSESGKEAAPLLKVKRAAALECLPKYQALCLSDPASRNTQIDRLLEALEKGIVLKAE